ncbi:hypothetical protein MMC10_001054 [Thelotrema lepadinum]|nr:hypothetical protein [Thelotrema lepadinum]
MVPLYSAGRRIANIDVDYRPPRLSMFPMSYGERAWLRSLKRQALRQSEANESHSKKSASDASHSKQSESNTSPAKQEEVSRQTQTDMSYCYHQCSQHPEVTQSHGGDGKKPKDGKGKDDKGGEAQSKKDKGKGGKGKGKPKDSDDDGSGSSSNDEGDKKPKGKGGKTKEDKPKGNKGDKGERSKQGEIQNPLNAFLPYPWNSPNFAEITGSIRRPSDGRKEQHPTSHGTSFEHAVESARRADEESVIRWLAERDGSYIQDAMKWLEERDAARLGKLMNLTSELTALNLNLDLQNPTSQIPWGPPGPNNLPLRRNVSFAGPGGTLHPLSSNHGTPNFGLPYHHGQHGGFPAGQDKRLNTVVAGYDENTDLRLEDGTKVIIKANQGYAPPVPFPGSSRPPLQPVGDTAGGVHWSQPAQARPNTQNQPAFAGRPAYQQGQHPGATNGHAYRQDRPATSAAGPGFRQNQPQPRMSGARPRFDENQPPVQDQNRKPSKWYGNAFESDHGLGDGNGSEKPPWGGSNNHNNGGGGRFPRNSPAPSQNDAYRGHQPAFPGENDQNDFWGAGDGGNTGNGGVAPWPE